MENPEIFQIITFYEFKRFGAGENLTEIKKSLESSMRGNSISGTIILAGEGFNATVCGAPNAIEKFVAETEKILETKLKYKSSVHAEQPFRRVKVKIKPEIVTLKKTVEIERGIGTHAKISDWNAIINDAETIVLDARNDYEVKIGTFKNAVNPQIERFSDLPEYAEKNLDPQTHKKIAMFCTGGIRCEKFAPYLKEMGFAEVYQLDGGILKYLAEMPEEESLWSGECFVFDERTSVDERLRKGEKQDLSLQTKRQNKSK